MLHQIDFIQLAQRLALEAVNAHQTAEQSGKKLEAELAAADKQLKAVSESAAVATELQERLSTERKWLEECQRSLDSMKVTEGQAVRELGHRVRSRRDRTQLSSRAAAALAAADTVFYC